MLLSFVPNQNSARSFWSGAMPRVGIYRCTPRTYKTKWSATASCSEQWKPYWVGRNIWINELQPETHTHRKWDNIRKKVSSESSTACAYRNWNATKSFNWFIAISFAMCPEENLNGNKLHLKSKANPVKQALILRAIRVPRSKQHEANKWMGINSISSHSHKV